MCTPAAAPDTPGPAPPACMQRQIEFAFSRDAHALGVGTGGWKQGALCVEQPPRLVLPRCSYPLYLFSCRQLRHLGQALKVGGCAQHCKRYRLVDHPHSSGDLDEEPARGPEQKAGQAVCEGAAPLHQLSTSRPAAAPGVHTRTRCPRAPGSGATALCCALTAAAPRQPLTPGRELLAAAHAAAGCCRPLHSLSSAAAGADMYLCERTALWPAWC